MKKLFKNLMPMLLLVAGLGIAPNIVKAGGNVSYTGGTIYFDNSETKWAQNYIQIMMRQTSYAGISNMSPITNTKLYYAKDPEGTNWGDCYGWAVVYNSSSWAKGNFENYNCSKYSAYCTYGITGSYYLAVPDGTNNGFNLSCSWASSQSALLDKTHTFGVKVKGAGEDSYSTPTSFPGTISVSSYKMNAYNTVQSSNASITGATTSKTFMGAYTAQTTFSAPDVSGYTFRGWYDDSDTKRYDDAEFTIYPTTELELYACYEENAYYIKHGWKDGADNSWSYKPLTANGDGTFYIDDWYGGTGCNWRFLSDGDEKWIGTPTLDNEPAKGDKCIFTLNPTANFGKGTITITPKSYTLTLDNNGGTITSGQNKQTVTVTYGQSTITGTWEVPTRTGYKYGGYFKSGNNTYAVILSTSQSFSTSSSNPYAKSGKWSEDGDRTVYAKWTANEYTVRYNANGGQLKPETTMPDQKHTYDQEIALTTNNFEKTGYTFLGWGLDKNSTTATWTDGKTVKNISTGTTMVILYAIWKAKEYSITLSAGDYPNVSDGSATVKYDATQITINTLPTRTGYNISQTSSYCSDAECTNSVATFNGNLQTTSAYTTSGKWSNDGNVTLYTKWVAKTCSLTLDNNGADIKAGDAQKVVTYDASPAKITIPQKTGKVFAGYYTANGTDGTDDGWGLQLIDDKGAFVANVTDYMAGGKWAYSGELTAMTLYAKWNEPEPKKVYFGITDGTNTTSERGSISASYKDGETSIAITSGETEVPFGKEVTISWSNSVTAQYYAQNNAYNSAGWWNKANTTDAAIRLKNDGNTYAVTIASVDINAYVYAQPNLFDITVPEVDHGTASASPTQAGPHFRSTLTATPATGYDFTAWTISDNTNGKFVDEKTASDATTYVAAKAAITVTPSYTIHNYNITYNGLEDGTHSNPATYTIETPKITLTDASRTGYDFDGWYSDNGTWANKVTSIELGSHADVVLYAKWTAQQYTISYKDEGNIDYSGNNLASLPATHIYDTPTSLVAGTKTGYEFQGWFTDSLCTDEHIITTIGGKAITTDTTLYAKWQINTYNITYPNDAAQEAGCFTITDAPETANYQETVTFKAAPIYGYEGSVVSVTAGGVQLSKEGDTYTFVMGDADVEISVTPSTKRTCYITASCESDWGTITNSGKSKATDMFVEHEYTFNMNSGLTFLKWNIANAKCAPNYTERSYPTIKIIATSEEATISPAIMETYTNVTLNFEPTYMGYIKLNGNNIASGTKTDVSTRTTATIEACTNYGYKFVGWTATNTNVVTFDPTMTWDEGSDAQKYHRMAGVVDGGKTVLTAHFVEDTYSGWEIGYMTKDGGTWTERPLNKRLGETDQHIGYYTVNLTAGYAYALKVKHGSTYFGCPTSDWIVKDNCAGFILEKDKGDCYMSASAGGDYVFRVDFSDENKPKVTVLYPDGAKKIIGDQIFYFYSKYNESVWSNPIFRIGNESYAETRVMTRVPGTTHLWQYEVKDGWCNYKAIQIANNHGYSGTGKASDKMIYNMGKQGTDKYYISDGTSFLGGGADISTYMYWEPNGSNSGDYKTNYYTCYESTNPNVNATRKFNRNVVKPTQAQHGTIIVEQWLSDDGSNRELISSYDNYGVSPSRWITITATAEKGYRTQMISVTTADNKTEDYYNGDSWDYVVHQDITKITATYELVRSNTFYVKNHADWIAGGHDIWLHYWDATEEPNKKTNWAFPGRMATKMDDTKTWYAVTIENTFFNVNGWKLSQGNTDRQTVDYFISSKTWDPANMNGKYYEIVLNTSTSPHKWELQPITENIPTFYRVLVTKGDQTFTSNTVQSTDETLSFFAAEGCTVTLQKGSSTGWKDNDITSTFTGKSGVWTAKTNAEGNALTDLTAYTGKYYIRTDGVSGGWEDYKNAAHAFTQFTKREGETFSYYWVATVGKANSGTTNVKAKIANEYNNHLSVEIVNDKNTDAYGNIDNASFGSNIRFSYEPTTNAFEREIISGSAGDVYLNIVGKNLYSDESCGSAFALNEANYKTNPKESKLADISDWVYEKTVYVYIPDNATAATVELRSLYNNQRTALYTGDVMQKGTSTGKYKIRLTYDFKKNRIITSWSPSSQEITQSMVVDADIQFLQVEKGDVSQISIKANGQDEEAIKVSSLDYLLFVLEIEQGGPEFEHYRISLPFDCKISDIYGIGGFDELWGIQEYDGKTRSEKGWLDEKTNYWRWLTKDETLKAGVGYSITVDKAHLPFKTIEEEVTRTICNEDGTECKDVTTYESRAALRLYFPSATKEFTLSRAQNGAEAMQVENWACNIPGRTVADANWHFMGSTGYNNIKITSFSGSQDVPYYLYILNADETAYEPVSSVEKSFSFRSFKAYMFQYTGTINWAQYTRSQHDPVSAPRYSATQHTPLKLKMNVMEEGESVAHAYIELNDNATFGFDQNHDLAWMNSNSVAQVYTESENEPYAANCVPFESAILPMTVKTLHAGDYTLHLEGADNVAVYLIDYQLQTETLISAGDVEVELEKGSSNNRFALRFDVAAAPTDMKNANGETMINGGQKTQKLLINDNIYLINAGRVYNVMGVEE